LNKFYFHVCPLLLLLSCSSASAAMFATKQDAVSSLGNAYAGSTVNLSDASIGYYNPAGLVRLGNFDASISGSIERSTLKVDYANATSDTGVAIFGKVPIYSKKNRFLPQGHLAFKINKHLTAGISLTNPFAFKTSFANDSITRYKDLSSNLNTYDISPSLGIRVSNAFSVGFGINWLMANIKLKNYTTETTTQTLSAKGNKLGYHLGALWQLSPKMRLGLAYHSSFNVKLNGTLNSSGGIASQNVTSKLSLPDKIVYSIFSELTKEWTMMADIERAHWSRLKNYTVVSTDGSYTSQLLANKNTWRVAVGFNYLLRAWLFKFGFAFEQGASKQDTTLRVPDSDSYQLACGLNYMFNKNFSIDFGYAHLFYKGAKISQSGFVTNTIVTKDTLNGERINSLDILGIQLNLKIA
jgi:long-chain fatty acid transport protein